MNEQVLDTAKAKKNSAKKQVFLKKLDPESGKLLATLKERANKKAFGRKVRDTEILAVALRLVEPSHLSELQSQTLSGRDRLQMAHDDYQKKNGKISLDEFIERLIPSVARTAP